MTLETRIADLFENATAVALVVEASLRARIIMPTRAQSMIEAIRTTFAEMAQVEASATPEDFDAAAWHHLRSRLTNAQKKYEAILAAGSDCSSTPCRNNSRAWR